MSQGGSRIFLDKYSTNHGLSEHTDNQKHLKVGLGIHNSYLKHSFNYDPLESIYVKWALQNSISIKRSEESKNRMMLKIGC